MSSRHRVKSAALAALLAAVMSVGLIPTATTAQSDGEATKVAYLLPFRRSIAFWPVHLAEELGYFEEEGLSVASESTDGSSFVVQQVAADAAEFGIATSDPILLGFEQSPNFQMRLRLPDRQRVRPVDEVRRAASRRWPTSRARSWPSRTSRAARSPASRSRLRRRASPRHDVTIQPVGEDAAIQAEALAKRHRGGLRGLLEQPHRRAATR